MGLVSYPFSYAMPLLELLVYSYLSNYEKECTYYNFKNCFRWGCFYNSFLVSFFFFSLFLLFGDYLQQYALDSLSFLCVYLLLFLSVFIVVFFFNYFQSLKFKCILKLNFYSLLCSKATLSPPSPPPRPPESPRVMSLDEEGQFQDWWGRIVVSKMNMLIMAITPFLIHFSNPLMIDSNNRIAFDFLASTKQKLSIHS